MPPVFFIAEALVDYALASGVGTAVAAGTSALSAGEAISGAVNSGPGAPAAQPPPPNNYMSPSQISGTIGSIAQQFPGFTANTGGGLSPASLANTAGNNAGAPGDMGLALQAVNQWLGGGAGSPTPEGSSAPSGANPAVAPAQQFDIKKLMQGYQPNRPGLTLQNPF